MSPYSQCGIGKIMKRHFALTMHVSAVHSRFLVQPSAFPTHHENRGSPAEMNLCFLKFIRKTAIFASQVNFYSSLKGMLCLFAIATLAFLAFLSPFSSRNPPAVATAFNPGLPPLHQT